MRYPAADYRHPSGQNGCVQQAAAAFGKVIPGFTAEGKIADKQQDS